MKTTQTFSSGERLVATLVEHFGEHHWRTVVGASGSGKSSLVRAGLIPGIKKSKSGLDCPHLDADCTSTRSACNSTDAWNGIGDGDHESPGDLARDSRALRIYIGKSIGENWRLLLVIDQFEELFTLCRDEQERKSFIDNLLLATAPGTRSIDLCGRRAPRRPECTVRRVCQFARGTVSAKGYIGPMAAEETRHAIQGPAERGGWELETGRSSRFYAMRGTSRNVAASVPRAARNVETPAGT